MNPKNVLSNPYVGAAAGATMGYATSTGVIAGAIGGAAGVSSFPLYCNALEYLNPDTDKTTRVFQAALLSTATGLAAPVLLTYAAGIVVGALLTAAIPTAFIAYQAYKIYKNNPELVGYLKLAGRVTALLPASGSEKNEQPKKAAAIQPEEASIPVRSLCPGYEEQRRQTALLKASSLDYNYLPGFNVDI